MAEKKKRGFNYTAAEKDILLELIKKYNDIIENKTTSAHMIQKKKDAWDAVCQQYNAVAVSGIRTRQQLRHLYENLKQKLRKNIAKANHVQFYEKTNPLLEQKVSFDKKQINYSGGGSYKSTLTEHEAQILALSAPQIVPLSNPYDDAAIYFDDDEVNGNENESEIASSCDNIIIIDDHHATTADYSAVSRFRTESPDIPDGKEASVADKCIGETNRPQTSSKTGARPKQNNIKQQYFRNKLRNAKLEHKYLMNLNKMAVNKYKIEMQILKLKLNKMKDTRTRR